MSLDFTDLEGNEVNLDTHFFDGGTVFSEYTLAIGQLGMFNTISVSSNHILVDRRLTPEERIEQYYSHYWYKKY